MTEQGTFEDGLSTLQLLGDPEPERLADVRARLSAVREQRARPSRDDKVVAAWNSWLICSLIDAAMVFNEPTWLERPNRRRVAAAVHWPMPGCADLLAAWVLPRHPRGLRGSYPSLRAAGGRDRRADVAGTRPGTLRCDSEPVR